MGDYVRMGSFEQDGNQQNGKEGIEWLVLSRENGKALLVSRYALDTMEFGTGKNGAKWSNSSVSKWLNEDFLRAAFSESEQNAIVRTQTTDTTDDMVFLLSDSEVRTYFADDAARRAEPSAAVGKKADTKDGCCSWWLRSTSTENANRVMIVDSAGKLQQNGLKAQGNSAGIRPAMWIDLTKAGLQSIEPLDASAQVGDTVAFGSYAPGSGNPEPVEWLVLERKGNVVTMITQYLIDAKAFEETGEPRTWEACSLRKWLNGDFISRTFSDAERNALLETSLETADEPETADRVYLLSDEEMDRFFPEGSGSAEKSKALDAARIMDDFNWWWLRTKDDFFGNPMIVNTEGVVSGNADGYGFDGNGVRPVIRVNLDAL